MRFFSVFVLCLSWHAGVSQGMKDLYPSEIKRLDFGPSVQKEWAMRDEAMAELSKGKDWDDLTEVQRALIDKYGEVYESMWDIEGAGCSWYCGGGPKKVTASSSLSPQGDNSYSGRNAHDLSYMTAWVEGVKGEGVGEFLLYEFSAESPRINTIIVVNGYVKSVDAWKNNGRVKRLKMYVNDKPYAILNLEDLPAAQTFNVEPIGESDRANYQALKAKPDWKLKFEILEVYHGQKYDDVAITEIYFSGLDVHCLGKGTQVTMADGSLRNIELLRVGESVLSYNAEKRAYESSSILELANPVHEDLVELTFEQGQKLIATPDHPFFHNGRWFSFNPEKTRFDYQYDEVLQLEKGQRLGEFVLTDVISLRESRGTFTIVRLSRNNTFIANGIIVGTEPLRFRSEVACHDECVRLSTE